MPGAGCLRVGAAASCGLRIATPLGARRHPWLTSRREGMIGLQPTGSSYGEVGERSGSERAPIRKRSNGPNQSHPVCLTRGCQQHRPSGCPFKNAHSVGKNHGRRPASPAGRSQQHNTTCVRHPGVSETLLPATDPRWGGLLWFRRGISISVCSSNKLSQLPGMRACRCLQVAVTCVCRTPSAPPATAPTPA